MAIDLTPEYAQSLGRIGGGLLADNLKSFQDGGDLQFDTDLLYLDVANKRIGINNYGASPAELYLGGDKVFATTNVIADTFLNNNWTISSNTINVATGIIYLTPNQANTPTIVASGVGTSNLNLTASGFSTVNASANIQLTPDINGGFVSWTKGSVSALLQDGLTTSLTTVTGNAYVTQNLYANGTINFGQNSSSTDTVSFTAELNADLQPSATNTDTIGSNTKYWDTIYTNTITVPTLSAISLNAGGIRVTGNTITSINSANDITLAPQGTGNVKLNGIYPFSGNTIQNSTSLPYSLLSTNDGYFNFAGTSALVIPTGTTAQRITTTLGATRYNSDIQYLEIYNGQSWQNVIGTSPPTTAATAADLGVIYDLILG
jgi:hypothetical protein